MFAAGGIDAAINRHRAYGRGLAVLAGLAFAGLSLQAASAAETKTYVVSWFNHAAYSQDGDCPDGKNPPADVWTRKIMADMGKTQAQIDAALKDFPNTAYGAVPMRGKIDGKPANVYVNPTSIADPQIHTVKGRYSYGFNLDGKGAASPNSFEEPDTHELGINNQVFRALGCYDLERGSPTGRPTFAAIQWDMTRDQMPAWVIEITAVNGFDKDGDVTVGLYRAVEPITRNAAGDPQSDMAFRIDPSPRSQNVLHGKLKNGVVTTDPSEVNMIGDPFSVSEYHFKDARVRLALKPDGSLKGILGGYQPWRQVYSSYAMGGSVNELNLSIDVPGIYYAFKRLADAYPDPKTGENTAISTAYEIEAVPAFLIHPSDNKTAEADGPMRTAQNR